MCLEAEKLCILESSSLIERLELTQRHKNSAGDTNHWTTAWQTIYEDLQRHCGVAKESEFYAVV